MVAKKKKKRPSRELEAELEDANTVDSEVKKDKKQSGEEVWEMQNLKISVKTVKQLLAVIEDGQEVFTKTDFIRQDTNEIVAVCTSDNDSFSYRIDPSEWAYDIAVGIYETFNGEGQDPETINPIEDGYEFIAK